MKALATLLVLSLATLAFSLVPDSSSPAPAVGPGRAKPAPERSFRTECAEPHSLRLHRFEDGSARLECAGRVLVRVSVPR